MDWHGLWTQYTPQGEVMQSFQSLRSFKIGNSEQTLLNKASQPLHVLRLEHTGEGIWIHSGTNRVHPQCCKIVGTKVAFFESSHGVFFQLHLNHTNIWEIFKLEETIRHSTDIDYEERKLVWVASIREDSRGYPGQWKWSQSQSKALLVTGKAFLSLNSLSLRFRSLCKLNSSGDGRVTRCRHSDMHSI